MFDIFLSYSLYLAGELFQDRDTEIQYRFRITFIRQMNNFNLPKRTKLYL